MNRLGPVEVRRLAVMVLALDSTRSIVHWYQPAGFSRRRAKIGQAAICFTSVRGRNRPQACSHVHQRRVKLSLHLSHHPVPRAFIVTPEM